MIESRHPALELLPRPSEKYESTSARAPWRRQHIIAVNAYLAGMRAAGTSHGPAVAILALADGIETFIRECGVEWPSPLESEWVAEAINSFCHLLNLDLGGLDAGTLNAWAGRMYDEIGWDADRGELR